MPNNQLSLFSSEATPKTPDGNTDIHIDPIEAFESWLDRQSPRFRASSKKIYRWLWAKFLRFMKEQGVSFLQIEPNDITLFLASLEDVKRPQRERYYKLIARAFEEITILVPNYTSPVNHLIQDPYRRTWRAAPNNEPMQFVGRTDRTRLQQQLQVRFQTLSTLTAQETEAISAMLWRETRDLAIVATLFACGIKPAELAALSVSCVSDGDGPALLDTSKYEGLSLEDRRAGARDPNEDATHAFVGDDAGAHRLVPIPGWAYRILQLWLRVRELDLRTAPPEQVSRFHRLFPGSRRVTTRRPSSLMNMATLARIVSKWGDSHAGLELTPQRLRNTYGATLVDEGLDLTAIEKRMGYAPGAASAFRLRVAWGAFDARQANLQADEMSREQRDADASLR